MNIAMVFTVLYFSAFSCFLLAAIGKYQPLVGWVGGILLSIAGLLTIALR